MGTRIDAVTKVILLVGAMLLVGWYYYFQTDAARATRAALPPPPAPSPAALAAAVSRAVAAAGPAVTPAGTPSVATVATPSSAPAAATTAAPDTRPEWIRNPPELGITRVLAGDQAVSYDGRARTVLGTKNGSAQPVLLVRDEVSGQIDYFQSGLTFRLQSGLDFETFIRERKAMQRHFSNTDYATVLVDAGSIASEYNSLQNDPRVTLVTFLKLKTLTNPR